MPPSHPVVPLRQRKHVTRRAYVVAVITVAAISLSGFYLIQLRGWTPSTSRTDPKPAPTPDSHSDADSAPSLGGDRTTSPSLSAIITSPQGSIEIVALMDLGEPTSTTLLNQLLVMIESAPPPPDDDAVVVRAVNHASTLQALSRLASVRKEYVLAQQLTEKAYNLYYDHPDQDVSNFGFTLRYGSDVINSTIFTQDAATAGRVAAQMLTNPSIDKEPFSALNALGALDFEFQPDLAQVVTDAYENGWLGKLITKERDSGRSSEGFENSVLRAAATLNKPHITENIVSQRWAAHLKTPTLDGLQSARDLARLRRNDNRVDESGEILLTALRSVDLIRAELQKPSEFSFPEMDSRRLRNTEMSLCSELQSAGQTRPDLALVAIEHMLDQNLVTDTPGRENLIMQRADLLNRLKNFAPPGTE